LRIDVLPTDDDSSFAHSISGSAVSEVYDMQVVEESGTKKLFYAYMNGNIIDVGKADASSDDLSSEDDNWLTTAQSQSISGSDTFLATIDGKLLIKDQNEIDVYNTIDSTYTAGAIVMPTEVEFLEATSNYVAAAGKDNTIYIWDGHSDTWNYTIPVDIEIMGLEIFRGITYFLTGQGGDTNNLDQLTLNRVNNSFSGFERLREIVTPIDEYPAADHSSARPGLALPGLISGSDGVYFVLHGQNKIDGPQFYYVYRYGSKPGLEKKMVLPSVKRFINPNNVIVNPLPSNGGIHIVKGDGDDQNEKMFMFVIIGSHFQLHEAFVQAVGDHELGSMFETIEKDVPQRKSSYTEGLLESIAIYYTDNYGFADILGVIDGSTETPQEGGSISWSGNKTVVHFSDQSFQRLAVQIDGDVPKVSKIEAQYKVKTTQG